MTAIDEYLMLSITSSVYIYLDRCNHNGSSSDGLAVKRYDTEGFVARLHREMARWFSSRPAGLAALVEFDALVHGHATTFLRRHMVEDNGTQAGYRNSGNELATMGTAKG